ncbi:MAG: hypothetical protein MJ048_03080 [Acidaminococcaceae bacterium]|nr:hypothetical protein [Acidaminococcaceae bacterium]
MKKSALMVAMMVMVLSVGDAFAANEVNVNVQPDTTVNVTVQQANRFAGAVTNWEKAETANVVVTGTGVANPEFEGAQARLMARRAAIVDGYRMLLEYAKDVRVDSETLVKDLMGRSDVVSAKISGTIKGAKIIDEGESGTGKNYYYWVKMSIPVFGANSVAAATLPEVMKNTPTAQPPALVTKKNTALTKAEFKEVRQEVKTAGYTGIVIDAGGTGLETTMAPQIIDTNGRVVYGMENIDVDFAVSHGLVEYSKDLNAAAGGSTRAGTNPLVIKATGVRGGTNSVNPVNATVSPEDADKILLAAQNNPDLFKNGAVVFVR